MVKKDGVYHVEPLRTATEIEEMNIGLRVNDLVRLKVRDVKDKTI